MDAKYSVLLVGLAAAHNVKNERARTRVALMAVTTYLRICGAPPNLTKPLRDLWCALADADRGVSNDLVDRLPYKGGTQKEIVTTFNLAWGAAKITLAMKGGSLESEAVKEAAKELGLDARKLREFRKNIQRGHAAPRAKNYYQWLLEDLALPEAHEARLRRWASEGLTIDDFTELERIIIEVTKA